MQMDEVKRAAVQAADLTERLSRISRELAERNLQAADYLQRTAQAAPGLLRVAANQACGTIATEAAQAVRQGLNEPLDSFDRQLVDTMNRINGVTHGLAQSQLRMQAAVGKLVMVVAGVLVTMLLVVTACAGMVWHYKNVIAQYQIEADLMRAYNQADVTLCNGQLCARVDKASKAHGEYVPVKPR